MKVFVGISGGVDSAVSAALLKKQGYTVTGVFMKNWSGDDYGIQSECPWEEDQEIAMKVCDTLGIEFRSYNFEKEYREKVVEYFFDEYKKGRTPNPDVMCNKEIKFKLFLDKALKDGADCIATGHYVRRSELENIESKKNNDSSFKNTFNLLKGVDSNKDQSYFLYNITQEQLSKSLFPVGEYIKPKVRELAHEFNLPNANRADSQGICFIGEINVLKFLQSQIPEEIGDIVDIDTNEVVGKHKGIYFYTIGQREGLNIGGLEKPYFVCSKDKDNNILYVCSGSDNPKLYSTNVKLENIHFINPNYNYNANNLSASVRYRQKPQLGSLDLENKEFNFKTPQRAVTSGQSLVIYDGDICIGGGIIA